MKAQQPQHPAKHSSWAYAEQHAEEEPAMTDARLRAEDLGVRPPSQGVAALLTVLAAAAQAHTLVEVGTGVGVSGLALLRGARSDAVLTSIDYEADHIQAARETFRDAKLPSSRARLITGRAGQVLARLTTGAYDVVFIDADQAHCRDYAEQGIRLLRPSGLLVINDALDHDRVPRPAVRDDSTQTLRSLERALQDDERLHTSMLGTGTGLLIAARR
ncbi:O-methyltransferase [Nesterenkonia lutea]|uniref:O-methyltransferase YrrM n=1 Tax=Nesterenkonia lutea TaxID=272919 RepID=A0ABR9JFI1_9MICC|nr:class I SAM-dependent methyltransferase [Nesterenkonia lutea]MBE1524591.1 putative O-methyltransferase YrrM [Nesterenkonia lutea]